MKKWLKVAVSVLFVACLCFTLAACDLFGGGSNNNNSSSNNSSSNSNDGNNQQQVDSDGTFIYSGSSVKAASTSISGDIVIPTERNGSPIDTIPANAFKGCNAITSITVPKEITSIGSGAFNGCSSLRSITLPFIGSQKGNTGTKEALFGHIFRGGSYQGGTKITQSFTDYHWDTSETYIPSSLRSVTITNETIINYGAFEDCSMLTKIDLNDEITQVGATAFINCSKITEINLPSISIIPYALFSGCISLVEFTINDSVDTIGSYAFSSCNALSKVNSEIAGTFIVPNSVTSIGAGAFNGCAQMQSITLPFIGKQKGNSETEAALFGYIFKGDEYQGGTEISQQYTDSHWDWADVYIPSSLRSVTITNETVIARGAFQNCSMLQSITINSSANQNVGVNAFSGTVKPTWN